MSSSSGVNIATLFADLTVQMNRYFGIIIFVIGTIGNVLNIFVLSQKTLRSNPCAWLFLMSSIASIIAFLSGMAPRFLSSWKLDLSETNGLLCKVRGVTVFASLTATFWFITLATIDRWLLSSTLPSRRQKSTIKNAQRGTIIVAGVSVGIYVQMFYCYDGNQINTPLKCYARTPPCRLLTDLSFALITVFFPLLFMLLFGSMTIWNIRQSRRQVQQPIAGPANSQQVQRKKIDRQLVIMLFFQITILFVLSMPCPIQRFYLTLKSPDPVTGQQKPLDNFIYTVALLTVYLANRIPFYIYTISGGSTFRKASANVFLQFRRMIVRQ